MVEIDKQKLFDGNIEVYEQADRQGVLRTINPILERVFLGRAGMPGSPTEWAKCRDVSTRSEVCHFSFRIALDKRENNGGNYGLTEKETEERK
jgi:hypothetical protein